MVKVKRLVASFLMAVISAVGFVAHADEDLGVEQQVPPAVIRGTVVDKVTDAPVAMPLFLRLSKVENNGLIWTEVGYTYLKNGHFSFVLDQTDFHPGQYNIESLPYVPEPAYQSYLGSSITFSVGYGGAYVSFAVEPTWVRITLDWDSVTPKTVSAEGALLSWGFWVEGNHQNLDVYARVGDLSSTGYPASTQVGYPGSSEPMRLTSVDNQYILQNVPVSGELPNGKFQCVWIFVTEPNDYERVLAQTGFCVPKPVTKTPVPVEQEE